MNSKAHIARRSVQLEPDGAHTIVVDDDDLPRFDVAHEGGPDRIEGACLRGQHPAITEARQGERAVAQTITHTDEPIDASDDERERSVQQGHHLDEPIFEGGAVSMRDQLRDDGRIRRDRTRVFVQRRVTAQFQCVDDVAVMRHGDRADAVEAAADGAVCSGADRLTHDGLDVVGRARPGGRIAAVTDRDVARERIE